MRKQPENVLEFAATYFEQMAQEDESLNSNPLSANDVFSSAPLFFHR
jgi:hypothetical protein